MLNVKKISEIINLLFTPQSLISPIPIFSMTLFFISCKFTELSIAKLNLLILGVFISLVSSGASNFWNHTNDLNEDIKNNKKTLLTKNILKLKDAVLISISLYAIPFILSLYLSITLNRPIYIYFSIWAFITWWYSDKIFFKKIFGVRLKTHYVGEIITYSIAYPAYTMSIWLIFSDSVMKGAMISLIFLCFGLSGLFLKDLKDIKGDREAGLKTLGVVFSPPKLIKTSCIFLILYYLLILFSINLTIFNVKTVLIVIPFFYFLKNTFFHFEMKKWAIEKDDLKNIKSMMTSTYASFIILGITNFI